MALEFNTMSRRGQWGVIIGLCAAMVGAFYYYIWQSNQEVIVRVNNEIAQGTMEIERTRRIAAQLPELEKELELLASRLEVLRIILPEQRQTDLLLRRVEAAASDSNLDVTRTSFEDPVPHDFYAEAPFSMDVRGTYHNLALFFERIGKFARIINIDQVSISALEGSAGNTIQAACTAKTFFFLEEEAAEGSTPANAQSSSDQP
ncbi:MAG: type 4a pilus biogenesis protein PilO [Acidobacteriota bacterium]